MFRAKYLPKSWKLYTTAGPDGRDIVHVWLLASGSKLQCTALHICQLDLLGIAEYIALVIRICNVCAKHWQTLTKVGKKRSRARVTIEGQCVLLQISLQIRMFDFLLNSQNHRMNHIFPGILLNPWKTL